MNTGQTRERNGILDPVIHLRVLEGEKSKTCAVSGGEGSCVMKTRKVKKKDGQHRFIYQGVG